MATSRVSVGRKSSKIWHIIVDGEEVAQILDDGDVQVEVLILAAQHLCGHYKSKTIDFIMSPDDMEIIQRVGMKKPKFIRLN